MTLRRLTVEQRLEFVERLASNLSAQYASLAPEWERLKQDVREEVAGATEAYKNTISVEMSDLQETCSKLQIQFDALLIGLCSPKQVKFKKILSKLLKKIRRNIYDGRRV